MNVMRSMLKLETSSVLKPWGLTHDSALSATGIRVGLGELWLASAQTGEGNYASNISNASVDEDLNQLLSRVAESGDEELESVLGERSLRVFQENPHRGKTEAWLVREAKGRAGFAGGPRTEAQCEELESLLTGPGLSADIESWSDSVRELFGLIEPVKPGEIYMVPAGTLHTMFAIGPESHLIVDEIQQGYGTSWLPTLSKILMVQDSLLSVQVHPSDSTVEAVATGQKTIDQDLEDNPTVRVYDFGRRPGEYPDLGFELTDPQAGLRRVGSVSVSTGGNIQQEIEVACEYFAKRKWTLGAGTETDLSPVSDSYHVIHCTRGSADLYAQEQKMTISRGETVFIPAAIEKDVRMEAQEDSKLFDDFVPDLKTVEGYLLNNGATEENVKNLMCPPRALEA